MTQEGYSRMLAAARDQFKAETPRDRDGSIRNIILFLALFVSYVNIWGQTDSMLFRVSTFDSFTEKSIPANVTVMSNDSAIIASFPVTYNEDWKEYVLWATIPRCSGIILKTESEGYVTQFSNYKFGKKEKNRVLPNIYLEKDLSVMLKEVTVTGSKVKMVYNGDTITYNAEVFKLANGSMQDALITSLPGVELDDNSNISVNGEFVSELIVNGRSFFKGNPLIALKNLPAYYVKKVKDYHQVSKHKQFLYGDTAKVDKTEDPFVMDVVLKHEYQEGWLGNAEVSHGIGDEYLARLFGMRRSKGNTLDYGFEAYSSIKIPDFKPVSLNMSYNATDITQKLFQTDDLRYNQAKTSHSNDFRKKYEKNPSFSSNFRLDLSSNLIETRNYRMSLRYTLVKNHSTGERNLYRLDEFLDKSNVYGQLGRLPSTEDSLQQMIGFANSYQVNDIDL